MPRGDGTGPNGTGTRSGRGLGICGSGKNTAGGAGAGLGRGAGGRPGRGLCNTNGSIAQEPLDTEGRLLKERAADLQKQLDETKRRLEMLDA